MAAMSFIVNDANRARRRSLLVRQPGLRVHAQRPYHIDDLLRCCRPPQQTRPFAHEKSEGICMSPDARPWTPKRPFKR